MSKEKINLPKLQVAAKTGAYLFPGHKSGLGENSESPILNKLNKLAKLVPSYPYSAIFLEGDTIYIAQSAGTKREEEQQVSTEPINLDKLKKSNEYQSLVKELKRNPDYEHLDKPNSTELNIKLHYYPPIGDHPDTEAIGAGFEGLIQHEFGEINEKLKAPKYLGLALFQSDRQSTDSTEPASCASCAAVVNTLNEKGFNISVKFHTPYKFPTDKNYQIPQFITNNPLYLDDYYKFLRHSLENLNKEINNETNLIDLYLKNEINNTNKSSMTKKEKISQISQIKQDIKDFITTTEKKSSIEDYEVRETVIYEAIKYFKSNDLVSFSNEIHEAQVEIDHLRVANREKLQKQENAKEKISNLGNKIKEYEDIKLSLEKLIKEEKTTTQKKINLNNLKNIESTRIKQAKIKKEIVSNSAEIQKIADEIKDTEKKIESLKPDLDLERVITLRKKKKNSKTRELTKLESQINGNKELIEKLKEENHKLEASLKNFNYDQSKDQLYPKIIDQLKYQTKGEILNLSALDNIVEQYNTAFVAAKEQYYKANYAGAEKIIESFYIESKKNINNPQNVSLDSVSIGSQLTTTATTNSAELNIEKKADDTKNIDEKTGIKALIHDITHHKIGSSDNIVIYIKDNPRELNEIIHLRQNYNNDQEFLHSTGYTEKLLNNAILYKAAINANIKVVNSEKIAATFNLIKSDLYKSRSAETEIQAAPLKSEDTSKNNDIKIIDTQLANSSNISSQTATTTTATQSMGAKAKRIASNEALMEDIRNDKFEVGTTIFYPKFENTDYFKALKSLVAKKELKFMSKSASQNGIDPDSYESRTIINQEQAVTPQPDPGEVAMMPQPNSWGITQWPYVNNLINFFNRNILGSNNQNLTKTEKEHLTNLLQAEIEGSDKYNLTERLAAVNDNHELLNKLDSEAVITANIGFKALDAQKSSEIGKVEIRGEKDHLADHKSNTDKLTDEIQNGTIKKDTVIAIERKQYGKNLGMKDAIKLANILEHNEKNPSNPIKLPQELENTPILQDAILYKTAREHGIKVISLEGRNLEHNKTSGLQDENREQYMADVIHEARSKGYNVVANVGSSHKDNLEKALEENQKQSTGFSNIPRELKQKPTDDNVKETSESILQKSDAAIQQSTTVNSTAQTATQNEAKKEELTNFASEQKLDEKGKHNLKASIAAVNDNQDLELIFVRAAVRADAGLKAINAEQSVEAEKAGSFEMRAGDNDATNHPKKSKDLTTEIQEGKIDKNTVIAIDPKQYGENCKMEDVIAVASILEHNEKNPSSPLNLPKGIENEPIYQGALLYKQAQKQGLTVVSLEEPKKDLSGSYENREQHMASVINGVRSKGYNVIADIGSNHKDNLEKAVEEQQKQSTGFSDVSKKVEQGSVEHNSQESNKNMLQEQNNIQQQSTNSTEQTDIQNENNIKQRVYSMRRKLSAVNNHFSSSKSESLNTHGKRQNINSMTR